MIKRVSILAILALAITIVLWLKPHVAREPVALDTPFSSPPARSKSTHATTVLLFADPREAEGSCGCAEIIRLVRDMSDVSGVVVREVDTRNPGEENRRYGVRVSPSVIILDAAGKEHDRFEGESGDTIEALRKVLVDLRRFSAAGARGESR